MKIDKLKNKNDTELKSELENSLREEFNLRVRAANRNLKQTHLLKKLKKYVAKIKTIFSQREKNKHE